MAQVSHQISGHLRGLQIVIRYFTLGPEGQNFILTYSIITVLPVFYGTPT